MLDPTDTIAAIASPPGPGFRGLIRLTGPDAFAVALAGFIDNAPKRTRRHAHARSGRLRVEGLRPLLPATVTLWPGKRTYTGQPLAEMHTVGSSPIVSIVLAHCLTHGARQAEPGEFTLRAFLSGRIDLTRAEAVLGVIDAQNTAQLAYALEQLAGGLSGPIVVLRDRLLDVLAHLEANLDFTEEPDVDPLGRAALADSLSRSSADLADLADRLSERDRAEGHPRVVLAGPPNAGKSQLFNALVGDTHALVSPHAGTTRDYLSALCECEGLTIELIDTAGIEVPSNPIEHSAQAKTADQSTRADLILACESADTGPAPAQIESGSILRVWTKCDIAKPPRGDLATSALTGAGLRELKARIAATLVQRAGEGNGPSGTAARCRESLVRASQSLESAAETIIVGGGDELVAIDLRQAIDDLGKVVGATVTDDILDRIFRRFCIGK